ncbi:MAG: PD-(D/E)XK nuclease domain-containing protein [Lachnospiraceae bacterium]|nr:PD-(D/E)XK nuclease domain-containing protein [Lachnospiraceae bacterium]
MKQEIELLIHGKTIEKPIHEDITYDEVYKTQDNLWNFLYFTGYLKKEKERQEEETILLTMKIPNREIRYIFSNIIRDWFTEKVSQVNRAPLHQAILDGDCEAMELILRRYLMEGISYYDNVESFYHGYIIRLLQGVPEYIMRSNREPGNGRPDIQLVPFDLKRTAIIIEIKKTEKLEEMENKCQEALTQI